MNKDGKPLETNKTRQDRIIKKWEDRKESIKPAVRKALEAGDPQAVLDALLPQHRRFCEEYIVDFNASAACVRAGYKCKEPNKMGYQLLNNPGIRYGIDALLAERAKTVDVDVNYIVKKIVRSLERAENKENESAVLRAAELLARHKGMFIDRQEISGPDGDAIRMEKVETDAADFKSAVTRLSQRSRTEEADGEDERGDAS